MLRPTAAQAINALGSELLPNISGAVMSATYKALLDRFGVLLNYQQLGEVLQRRPDGLRITLHKGQGEWARAIGAARVRIGRRVLFDTAEVARLIDEHRGR